MDFRSSFASNKSAVLSTLCLNPNTSAILRFDRNPLSAIYSKRGYNHRVSLRRYWRRHARTAQNLTPAEVHHESVAIVSLGGRGICVSHGLPRRRFADDAAKGIYQKTLHATAYIQTKDGSGSGWVIDRARKLLITNHHVVENFDTVLVFFPMYKDGKLVAERTAYKDERGQRGRVIDTDAAARPGSDRTDRPAAGRHG